MLITYFGLAGSLLCFIIYIVCVIRERPLLSWLTGFALCVSLSFCGFLRRDNAAYAILLSCGIDICILIIIYGAVAFHIRKNSQRYAYLLRLKEKITTFPLQTQYTYRIRVNTRSQLTRMNVDNQMIGFISSNGEINEVTNHATVNQASSMKLDDLISRAPAYSMNRSRLYLFVERMQSDSLEKSIRPVIPTYHIIFEYLSPKGRNYASRSFTFQVDDIKQYIEKISRLSVRRIEAQKERRLMTQDLRYRIMQRDHFRCVLCGRTTEEDGVKLHVDHILPVSKGGKTVPENLRTLCEDCNLGKGAKYSESGWN